jgi:hypothetical protein
MKILLEKTGLCILGGRRARNYKENLTEEKQESGIDDGRVGRKFCGWIRLFFVISIYQYIDVIHNVKHS